MKYYRFMEFTEVCHNLAHLSGGAWHSQKQLLQTSFSIWVPGRSSFPFSLTLGSYAHRCTKAVFKKTETHTSRESNQYKLCLVALKVAPGPIHFTHEVGKVLLFSVCWRWKWKSFQMLECALTSIVGSMKVERHVGISSYLCISVLLRLWVDGFCPDATLIVTKCSFCLY